MPPRTRSRTRTRIARTLAAALAAAFVLSAPAHAAGGGSDDAPSPLAEARNAIEAERYDEAIAALERLDRGNPDVLNLLGYAHRQAGRLDEALGYYTEALAIEPEHKGANEYLGELYLKIDDLAKAEARLAVLDDACFFPCSEYRDLEKAIAEYRKARGL